MTNEKKRTKDIELDENISFEDMLLSKPILEGLKNASYFKPSPIQLKSIPLGKLGLDLIVQAKSGTGKTCVFSVISLEHVLQSKSKTLQVLILAPTREVAIQITDSIKTISSNITGIKCNNFIGGLSLNQDKIKLKNCQIAVGTPGRILHLINENLLITSNIRLFIMDEADKLLEPEFQESINLIFSKLPDNKQIIFLSATYPFYMASYATRYMRSPTFVRLNIIDPSLRGIKQYYKITDFSAQTNKAFDFKTDALIKLLSSVEFQQAIVFTNYQIKAESLCKILDKNGWQSIFTSGHVEQNQRNFAMNQLKQFKCRILVSTDLTSRGVDAQNVDLVISMDVPADPETYLHRIGRAGRYGCQGIAVSFITEKEETAKFQEIIDSYCLKISQYGDNLSDILLIHNNIDEASRKDDFTIEKVKLNKEELDKSLFEYEKYKNLKKYEPKEFKTVKLDSVTTLKEIEENFSKFDINDINQKVCYNFTQQGFKYSLNDINEKVNLIKNKLNQKLGLEPVAKETKTEIVDLKDLYKWEPVEKAKKVEKEIKLDLNQIYLNYYKFYFKKYLNEE